MPTRLSLPAILVALSIGCGRSPSTQLESHTSNSRTPPAAALPIATPTPLAWVQEPKSYRGVAFGSSLAETAKVLGRMSCSPTAVGGLTVDLCAERDHMTSPVNGVPVYDQFIFFQGHFTEARGYFKYTQYATIRDVFLDKYGPSHAKETEPIQNMLGGTFQQALLTWIGSDTYTKALRFIRKQ